MPTNIFAHSQHGIILQEYLDYIPPSPSSTLSHFSMLYLHTHSFFFGLPVKVETQQRGVHLQGKRQGHEATCFNLVLSKVQAQQSGAFSDEFSHSYGSYSNNREKRSLKCQNPRKDTAAEGQIYQFPPSHDSLVEARPSLSTERLAISPSFSLWTPSLPTELWPRFRVSRLCVHGWQKEYLN